MAPPALDCCAQFRLSRSRNVAPPFVALTTAWNQNVIFIVTYTWMFARNLCTANTVSTHDRPDTPSYGHFAEQTVQVISSKCHKYMIFYAQLKCIIPAFG